MEAARSVLERVFGYQQFRALQETIIESVLAGEDNFVLMPTGGGKSLCYQIPALMREGVGIVVSPLISLMQDQVDALRANGVNARYYNSSLSSSEAREVLSELHAGTLDLLYVAPERLVSESFLQRLAELKLALFAIDEAHCVSQWGHDFRPEYVQLGELKNYFPHVPMIALTATADAQTREDVLLRLQMQKAKQHVASFDRPNIRYTVVEKHRPLEELKKFITARHGESGIVYCTTRAKVDELTAQLKQAGFSAAAYHAGMTTKARQQAQTAFQRDDTLIIVATVAFGMGIDKPNVRFIVHFNISKNIESYYQETGRAGRDGLPAQAIMFFGTSDIVKVRVLIEQNSNPEQKRIELHKLNAMVAFAEALQCRRRVLLNYFGEALENDCGNCDICLSPPETYDATTDAQKALSCVYRVNQRFGLTHVIDILRGADKQRIRQYGHDRLTTYGIGSDLSQSQWTSLFRQLIHRGYLWQDIANYSILKLMPQARALLKGKETLTLARPRLKVTAEKTKTKKIKKRSSTLDAPVDENLFETLRQLRKQLADEEGVPPFIIFSDAALQEMAALAPTEEAAFLAINGVGQYKLKAYGEKFMAAISDYASEAAPMAVG